MGTNSKFTINTDRPSPDVPSQIIDKFLSEAEITTTISTEVAERLKRLFLEEDTPNETEIRAALFPDA